MKFEGIPTRTSLLAKEFKDLITPEGDKEKTFTDLEQSLNEAGFEYATEAELSNILTEHSTLCRSESFSKVMSLILDHVPITLRDPEGEANMCRIASGDGFRVSLLEGFSGDDVANTVKTVITFRGNHLSSHTTINHNNSIWETKPETARVSVSGEGEIHLDDVKMVSFRIPTKLFPDHLHTETERELLEDDKIGFITRHFVPAIKKTVH